MSWAGFFSPNNLVTRLTICLGHSTEIILKFMAIVMGRLLLLLKTLLKSTQSQDSEVSVQ